MSGLLLGNKWKRTHAVHPLADCISLINPVYPWFFFLWFVQEDCKLPKSKDEVQVTRCGHSSFVCVCMCIEPHQWAQRGQQEGVMLLKSTTPICLSVRCLAWLSSTQWWCWQNDRRGAHSSECQFGCKAPFPQECWSSHTPKQKRERAVVFKRQGPTELDIYIKHTGLHACKTTYTTQSLLTPSKIASQQLKLDGT